MKDNLMKFYARISKEISFLAVKMKTHLTHFEEGHAGEQRIRAGLMLGSDSSDV